MNFSRAHIDAYTMLICAAISLYIDGERFVSLIYFCTRVLLSDYFSGAKTNPKCEYDNIVVGFRFLDTTITTNLGIIHGKSYAPALFISRYVHFLVVFIPTISYSFF